MRGVVMEDVVKGKEKEELNEERTRNKGGNKMMRQIGRGLVCGLWY